MKPIFNLFYFNFNIIKDYFNENLLFVYSENQLVIGFITGRLESPDILNVKREFKNKGIGTKLYNYLEDKAKNNNICIIKILCQPETSIPFWKKMGFEIKESNRFNEYIKGFKILNYNLNVPNGIEIKVEIKSYTDEVFYNKNSKSINNLKVKGILKDNIIYFNNRLIFPTYNLEEHKDLVLKIIVNNEEIFFEKTKRHYMTIKPYIDLFELLGFVKVEKTISGQYSKYEITITKDGQKAKDRIRERRN